jgi:putative tryptophan/tyrosine transport system substrate-binding protein
MRRRKFLKLLGGAAVAYPLVARADKTRRLGVLMNFHADDLEGRNRLTAVVQALQKFGWTADSNIQIEVRWAGDDVDLSHRYAEELIALAPDVLLASGSTSVVALQRVARSVAIVFVNVIDPVGAGFVSSLARPGGNTTGFVAFEYNISGKWLELLKKLAPQTTRIAVLRDPAIASGIGQFAVIQSAASSPNIDLTVIDSRDANEIERSLATFGREPNGGIIVTGSVSAITHRKLDAILTDSTPSSRAMKNATPTIPIVMAASSDAVANGLVASFNRPGGNITGMTILAADLASRRLQLLTEMVPGLKRVAVLTNPSDPNQASQIKQAQTAARSLSVELHIAEAAAPDKFESAFATIAAARAQALIVLQSALFFNQYPRIVAFTAASRLPALFAEKEVAQGGGLMAYGPSIQACFRRAAAYVDRIFRGANPAELPVELPATFEFVINLKTARELGLTVPDKLLSTADEVIE